MIKLLIAILICQQGTTLSITRKTANTLITASGFNTNFTEIEAIVNALTADNYADDSVTAAKLNSNVVRTGYGLAQHTDGSLYVPFIQAGDLLMSTVSTARTGWTNVSATYEGKFIRISATPLTTGGADTHTHGAGSFTTGTHTHTATDSGHGHSVETLIYFDSPNNGNGSGTGSLRGSVISGSANISVSTGSAMAISGTSASGDNIPSYVAVTMFKKDAF